VSIEPTLVYLYVEKGFYSPNWGTEMALRLYGEFGNGVERWATK